MGRATRLRAGASFTSATRRSEASSNAVASREGGGASVLSPVSVTMTQADGVSVEVIALATERAFGALRTAPRRLGNPGVPVPFSPPLEVAVLPGPTEIAAAIRDMLAG